MTCPLITYIEAGSEHTEIRDDCSYTLEEVKLLAQKELDRFNNSRVREGMPPREIVSVRWATEDELKLQESRKQKVKRARRQKGGEP